MAVVLRFSAGWNHSDVPLSSTEQSIDDQQVSTLQMDQSAKVRVLRSEQPGQIRPSPLVLHVEFKEGYTSSLIDSVYVLGVALKSNARHVEVYNDDQYVLTQRGTEIESIYLATFPIKVPLRKLKMKLLSLKGPEGGSCAEISMLELRLSDKLTGCYDVKSMSAAVAESAEDSKCALQSAKALSTADLTAFMDRMLEKFASTILPQVDQLITMRLQPILSRLDAVERGLRAVKDEVSDRQKAMAIASTPLD